MPSTDADFDLRQSPQSAFSMGDYTFADAGNLEHCAKYLNQTLVTFGFPSSLDLFANDPQVRTQQIHEMKKKEKEYIKLQERLNQVLMEKKKESRSGMEIMNLLQKEGRQRGTWNGKKVDAYEAKNQELMAENADLRALLRSMQAYMRDFLNAPNGLPKQSLAVNERLETDASQSPFGGKTDVFDLPFHMARDQIEESLRTKMASIKERMVQLQDAQKGAEVTSEATERELELEAQLVEARSIIQEQASIMSKHLAKAERPRESIISSPTEGV
ncbi:hypothetical protein SLEP1_g53975 [Rubroshorea leprosula]|uniref:Uncharacterized protein n=1 Tax=Rubroshorea leprosula TaxID=152421 RepID=A0AAV5MDE5_9ROSI|nr:hypothetical protein SLEP1_g53975 [Rubroshorea leprosula]